LTSSSSLTTATTALFASGEMLHTMGGGTFTGVAIHGGTIFAQTYSDDDKCEMFT
jgi:hypothetical protein